jgi:hypothetical protein
MIDGLRSTRHLLVPTYVLADAHFLPVQSTKVATNIQCLVCRMRSYHPKDIEKGWCAMCNSYHDDPRHRNRMVHGDRP